MMVLERKIYPIMDKYTPTYDLENFKQSNFSITTTALLSAQELGFEMEGIRGVVAAMKKDQFYKSMTSKYNHKVWQDVYHVPFSDYLLYIKFTAEQEISEFRLLSFKEK